MASERRDETLGKARNALEVAHRQCAWISATLRVLGDHEAVRQHEPWKKLHGSVLDAHQKSQAGYERLGRAVSEAAISFDPRQASSAADRAVAEGEIIDRQHEAVVRARRSWLQERTRLETDLAGALAEVAEAVGVLQGELGELDELSAFLDPATLGDAREQIEAILTDAAAVLGHGALGRRPLASVFGTWDAVRGRVAGVKLFVDQSDRRRAAREAEGGRESRRALESARDRLFPVRRDLREANRRLADPDLHGRRGAAMLRDLSAQTTPQLEELYALCEAALRGTSPAALREAEAAVDAGLEEVVDDALEINALFLALQLQARSADPRAAATAQPIRRRMPEAEEEDEEEDEEEPGEDDQNDDSPPPQEQPPAASTGDPAVGDEGVAPEPQPPAVAARRTPHLRSATESRVADFDLDLDSILEGRDPAEQKVVHSVETRPLLAWASEVEPSRLPRAAEIVRELRGWVQEHEDGAASGTPVEILEVAQACLTGALVDAVRDLPDDARVWQPENARRQTLQAWVRKHRGRPVHQRLVSRGVDADKLMGQLDLDLTMIAMERDLRVLRSVWTRVTFSATLVDGLLTEINNASGEW